MSDKVQLIKEEIERIEQILGDFNETHNNTIDNGIVTAKKNICKHIKSFIDSLPEEPVNEDLEEELSLWLKENCDDNGFFNQIELARYFAEWGRKHFEDKSEKVSENLEEAAKHYLYGAILYDDVYVGNPTEEDCIRCFKAGAEWQRKKDQETIELAEDHAMLAGMMKEREEMMKDAVDATIFSELKGSDGSLFQAKSDRFRMNGVKISDRIKVIPIKIE